MNKFKNFTENLMKVILVPDESSDSAASVTPTDTQIPIDNFSKNIMDYMNNSLPETTCDGDDESDRVESENTDNEADENISVYHDTTGLKISFNGLELTFPDSVAQKIKEVLGEPETSSETEENDSTEEDTTDDSMTEESEDNSNSDNSNTNDDDDDDDKKE